MQTTPRPTASSNTSLLDKAVILPVSSQDVCHYSEIALPFIKLAMEQSDQRISIDDIWTDLANRERQLWVIKDQDEYIAAVVTMVYTNSLGQKIGEISLAGGKNHARWINFADGVSAWFKEQGCDFCDIVGRLGWAREYTKRGFKMETVQMRRKL